MHNRLEMLEARVAELEIELEIRDGGNRGALVNAFALLVRLLLAKGVLDERTVRNGLQELFAPNTMEDEEEGRILHEVYQLLESYRWEDVVSQFFKECGANLPGRDASGTSEAG